MVFVVFAFASNADLTFTKHSSNEPAHSSAGTIFSQTQRPFELASKQYRYRSHCVWNNSANRVLFTYINNHLNPTPMPTASGRHELSDDAVDIVAVDQRSATRERLLSILAGKGQAAPLQVITPRPADAVVRLSPPQMRMWPVHAANPVRNGLAMPLACRIRGDIDASMLEAAVQDVVDRHEMLRSTFAMDDVTVVQRIHDHVKFGLNVVELTSHADGERYAAAMDLIRQDIGRPFDLERGPLLRVILLRLAVDQHILFINVHHMACDGWSLHLLTQALIQQYRARAFGPEKVAAPLRLQYGDYAYWESQRPPVHNTSGRPNYWSELWRDTTAVTELPLDRPRPAGGPMNAARLYSHIEADLSRDIDVVAKTHRATPFAVMLAALHLLVYTATTQRDQLIGVMFAKRPEALMDVIGTFQRLAPMRGRIDPALDLAEWVDTVRTSTLAALANIDVPAEASSTRNGAVATRIFLTQVDGLSSTPAPPGMTIESIELEQGFIAVGDLRITLNRSDVGYSTICWEYATDIFDKATVRRLADHYLRLIETVVAAPQTRIATLPMIPPTAASSV